MSGVKWNLLRKDIHWLADYLEGQKGALDQINAPARFKTFCQHFYDDKNLTILQFLAIPKDKLLRFRNMGRTTVNSIDQVILKEFDLRLGQFSDLAADLFDFRKGCPQTKNNINYEAPKSLEEIESLCLKVSSELEKEAPSNLSTILDLESNRIIVNFSAVAGTTPMDITIKMPQMGRSPEEWGAILQSSALQKALGNQVKSTLELALNLSYEAKTSLE